MKCFVVQRIGLRTPCPNEATTTFFDGKGVPHPVCSDCGRDMNEKLLPLIERFVVEARRAGVPEHELPQYRPITIPSSN